MSEEFFHRLGPDYRAVPDEAALADARTRGLRRRRRRQAARTALAAVPVLALLATALVLTRGGPVVVTTPPPSCSSTPPSRSEPDMDRLKNLGMRAVATAAVATAAACTPTADPTAPTPVTASPSVSSSSSAAATPSATGTPDTASPSPGTPTPGTATQQPSIKPSTSDQDGSCGDFASRTGVTGELIVLRGEVGCEEARRLATAYDQNPSQNRTSGDWFCFGGRVYDPELLSCKKNDGATYFYVRKPAPQVNGTDCGTVTHDDKPQGRLVLVRGRTTCDQGRAVVRAYLNQSSQLMDYGPWSCAGGREGDRAVISCGLGKRTSSNLQSAETLIELRRSA